MLVTKSAVATDAGISLQLRNMSGEQLEFTKLEVGSGQYGQDEATAEALRKRTTLKAKKQQFGISSIDVSSDKTTLILSSMITNTDLKEGYTIRELGLYARIKDQPDTECLVSVSLAEIEDEIPPYNSDPESRILMKYQFAVSDSDTVSLSYEHDPVALVEDVDAKVARLLEKTKTLQSELENVKKELIGVVKQTAIVNNNTTTEAGFALDARQANPNIAGTLAANILQLNNDFSTSNDVDFYEENIIYGSHFEPINDADRIRCIKYKNGMRVITGAVRCVSEINDSDYMVFTLPEGFERNPQHGRHGKQAWVSATSTADGKCYNCIFYNDRISLWGSVFPNVGNILSFYMVY